MDPIFTAIIVFCLFCLVLVIKYTWPEPINSFLSGESRSPDRVLQPPLDSNDILENLPTGVFVLDDSFEIKYVNNAFVEEVEVPRDELLDSELDTIFDVTEGLKQSLEHLEGDQSMEEQEMERCQLTFSDASGQKRNLNLSVSRLERNETVSYLCLAPTYATRSVKANAFGPSEK
ncbi:MAG: PAS domain S-box protein [bacterium]